ncbi:hypothetical protein PMZ80_000956 [Knufia obscura]|uniref:Uncharacterized protein n=2 Tax=Knufia TaxID=430999 RepID=A0AAN8EIA0_9EURO|nr:hypothetical protein PMZ80_000956 [Knufia obscura]KAK5950250.1 hypothetical protein OHC33_008718 [Knufia fluminis]
MATTPSLTGLPTELRLQIFGYLIAQRSHHVTSKDFRQFPSYERAEWRQSHPLLYVSRKIRDECSSFYSVTLRVSGIYDRILANENASVRNSATYNIVDILPTSLRRVVTKLVIQSEAGYDGRLITKGVFPKLQTVTLDLITAHWEWDLRPGMRAPYLDWYIQYTIEKDEPYKHIEEGRHDTAMLALTKETIHHYQHSVRNVTPRAVRTYELLCSARILLCREPQMDSDRSVNATMNLTWDFDTDEIVEKGDLIIRRA